MLFDELFVNVAEGIVPSHILVLRPEKTEVIELRDRKFR